jgi:hypothetical protein
MRPRWERTPKEVDVMLKRLRKVIAEKDPLTIQGLATAEEPRLQFSLRIPSGGVAQHGYRSPVRADRARNRRLRLGEESRYKGANETLARNRPHIKQRMLLTAWVQHV